LGADFESEKRIWSDADDGDREAVEQDRSAEHAGVTAEFPLPAGFGPRVPAVLVSPLIPAGTVFRLAADATPLDHTSILKTIETRWSLPALTKRDAAASSLGDVLTLTTPRPDDPLLGVGVPVATGAATDDKPSHLQEVYAELVSRLPVPDANGGTHHIMPPLTVSSEYDAYIRQRTAAWIATRRGTSTS
jgi:phospholipase C